MVTPKPETEEYNVQSFFYNRYRPFHPRRLFALLYDKFILQMEHPDDDDEEDEEEEGDERLPDVEDAEMVDCEDSASTNSSSEDKPDSTSPSHSPSTPETEVYSQDDGKDNDMDVDPLVMPSNEVILANKRAHPTLNRLFRSKGEFFLATRPHRAGEWSQAGAMLTLTGGRSWYCTLPEEEYTTGRPEVDTLVQHDIAKGGEWGDRRHEIVFIGEGLDHEGLEKMLDACLLTDGEYEEWKTVMRKEGEEEEERRKMLQELFEDGFPDWSGDDGEEEGHEGHDH